MKALTLFGLLSLFFAFDANAQYGGMVQVERTILCESNGYNYRECETGLERVRGVRVARQLSNSACIEGHSFSERFGVIRVSNGCRAQFAVVGATHNPQYGDKILGGGHGGGHGDGGHNGGYGMVTERVLCESHGHKLATCRIPLSRVREAYLERQHSKASCVEGVSYRISQRYIEVSQGCRGTFVVRGIR